MDTDIRVGEEESRWNEHINKRAVKFAHDCQVSLLYTREARIENMRVHVTSVDPARINRLIT